MTNCSGPTQRRNPETLPLRGLDTEQLNTDQVPQAVSQLDVNRAGYRDVRATCRLRRCTPLEDLAVLWNDEVVEAHALHILPLQHDQGRESCCLGVSLWGVASTFGANGDDNTACTANRHYATYFLCGLLHPECGLF